jgi:hypothetical protein
LALDKKDVIAVDVTADGAALSEETDHDSSIN